MRLYITSWLPFFLSDAIYNLLFIGIAPWSLIELAVVGSVSDSISRCATQIIREENTQLCILY